MPRPSTLVPSGVLALVLAVAACQDTPTTPPQATLPPLAEAPAGAAAASALDAWDLAVLRRSTARYHDVEAALADGFLADAHCVAAPPGGMGFHYVNPAHMDLEIDPSRPEALLYEPTENGGVRLTGAEFLVHGDTWDAAHSSPPTFAGQAFDPPSDRSATAPPGPFYTLHVWIWKENPSGMFAPFNPRVSCG